MRPDPSLSYPIGAHLRVDGTTHFSVWAPKPRQIALALEDAHGDTRDIALTRDRAGYATASVPGVAAGQRYQYRIDGQLLPDPASRWQPDGPSGPSAVDDPLRFRWTDSHWRGVRLEGQVLYEMHVGTFTTEGTWRAAIERLPALAATGITVVEVMPVAEFPGEFGWGYDGVFPFAPTRLYGTPDDFRTFVDRAHGLGLGVILDVVYNHLGPNGCVFASYAAEYFSRRYQNEWGEALNFDGEGSAAVREFFTSNAAYWIRDYHLDGLRLDATQSIHDSSPEHVVAAIARAAREAAARRDIILVSENETQHIRMVRPASAGGYGLDALWNDDFHHSAIVALTGRREAYYSDHHGTPQELVSAAKHGFLFQGQRYSWQKQGRGTRTDSVEPAAFVTFLENHDQLANSGDGSRVHQRSAPGAFRAMTALFLLMPGTPMLFQGQEFGATAPFLYFADHHPELAAAVAKGRGEFVTQFPSLASSEVQARLAVPHARDTFDRCTLQWEEFDRHVAVRRLHEDLLALRRGAVAFRQQRAGAVDGAVLGPGTFVLRYETQISRDERLLIVNLAADVTAAAFPEPLLAPPDGCDWVNDWSSEDPVYGGVGTPQVCTDSGWHIPGLSATVLKPRETQDDDHASDRA
jgi:maltooligosyltrehalose trehalohydrolase